MSDAPIVDYEFEQAEIDPAREGRGEDEPPLEWLEADLLGGFASGTAGLVRTRRYHALLLSALEPPAARMVLVNGVEAWLQKGSQPDAPRLALTTQCYASAAGDPVFDPDGRERIRRFRLAPWPQWVFALGELGEFESEVVVLAASGDTLLRWRTRTPSLLAGWRLHVRPLLSVRDYHSLHHENPDFDFTPRGDASRISWTPYATCPSVSALSNGSYQHEPRWFRQFWYRSEQARGLDAVEDLASPGTFVYDLGGRDATLLLRAGDSRGVALDDYVPSALEAEAARRSRLGAALARAARQYLVERAPGRTVIAGFPWFGDWGRDTFIAMRGLVLGTGQYEAAFEILDAWSTTVSAGMLPNRFPDHGAAEYNSVDASLWYIVAYHDLLQHRTPPAAPLARIQAAIAAILDGYLAGTRFGIGVAPDGLLAAGEAGLQLTWMDARVGQQVITPRIGKPVEIQALWFNALTIASDFAPRFAAHAARVPAAFAQRFIDAGQPGLYDVVDADHVSGRVDASIRPNQILAVGGLPYPLLDGAAARRVLDCVEAHLLTPLGLRTLAPSEPAYRGRYQGDGAERDASYHQGTVWPWLLGPFVDAWLRLNGSDARRRAEARERFLRPLLAHLRVAGIGHVSEIADGDAPHTPRGAPFQAWSLGELLRIQAMLAPVDDVCPGYDAAHVPPSRGEVPDAAITAVGPRPI